jgi:hypothetical protein
MLAHAASRILLIDEIHNLLSCVHIPVENERGFQRIVNTYSRRT